MKTCPQCHRLIPNDSCFCDCGYEYPVHIIRARRLMNRLIRPLRWPCPACGSRNTKVVGHSYIMNSQPESRRPVETLLILIGALLGIDSGAKSSTTLTYGVTRQCQDCRHLWGRKISNDNVPEKRHNPPGKRQVLRFLTWTGLYFSAGFAFIGVVGYGGNGYYYPMTIEERLSWLATALLLGGFCLYALKTTRGFRRWNKLPRRKKAIAAIPIVVQSLLGLFVIVEISLVVLAGLLN